MEYGDYEATDYVGKKGVMRYVFYTKYGHEDREKGKEKKNTKR